MTFDIDNICWEMNSLMKNNFYGSSEYRFNESKKLLLEKLDDIIEQNKEDLIKELENE